MPQNKKMKLGHMILSMIVLCVSACANKAPVKDYQADDKIAAIAQAMTTQNWSEAQNLTKNSTDPLLILVNHYALFQDEEYSDVLKAVPITSGPFESYDLYLRILSARESKRWDVIADREIPENLPTRLYGRATLAKAMALKELSRLPEARKLLVKFLASSRSSAFKGDALLMAADVEWDLGLKDDALKRYRTIYETYPVSDSGDAAVLRLTEGERIADIGTDIHLQRISRLQRAAQFKRADSEITQLLKKTTDTNARERLLLAQAQLAFASREYSQAANLAKKAEGRKLAPDRAIEWQNLLGWSLMRKGEGDDGRAEYQKLLNKEIPGKLRESILYRLGSSALDDQKWDLGIDLFSELRQKFTKGSFIESSHLFQAWSLYQSAISSTPVDKKKLAQANDLLIRLPRLPDGDRLEPQALYWRAKIADRLQDTKTASAIREALEDRFQFSFYQLLTKKDPFDFLKDKNPVKRATNNQRTGTKTFQALASWKRLEGFRAVHLMDWAQLEMDIFLNTVRANGRDRKVDVAEKLHEVEDWADLVRWSENHLENSLDGLHEKEDVLEFLYPRAYDSAVTKYATEFGVSPYLVWGLMREESRFEAEARSHAGAEGVMQLMPQLANRIGKTLGDRANTPGRMFDPFRNIRFGTFHLSELRDSVEDFPVSPDMKVVLLIASYNAGIDPVKKWVKEKDTNQLDAFVESIPYNETRSYVKRVLQSAAIYHKLYAQKRSKQEGNNEQKRQR